MAEDERTVEPTARVEGDTGGDATRSDAPASADTGGDRSRAERGVEGDATNGVADESAGDGLAPEDRLAPDDVVESLLELEADLEGVTQAHAEGERIRGPVTAAERRDATTVPDGYPIEAETNEVLAVTIDVDGEETTAYLEWPGENDAEGRLRWLLDAMGVKLGDVYGRRLVVERVGGYYVVVTPTERPRSNGDWGVGVAGGHAINAAILGLLVATGGPPAVLYATWALLSLVALPYATYGDAWYVRTHSDWDQGPLFWATLSALPVLNVVVGLAYLWSRRRATFFGAEPSLFARSVRMARSILR